MADCSMVTYDELTCNIGSCTALRILIGFLTNAVVDKVSVLSNSVKKKHQLIINIPDFDSPLIFFCSHCTNVIQVAIYRCNIISTATESSFTKKKKC